MEKKVNRLDKILSTDSNMFSLILASLVSADSLVDVKSCEDALNFVSQLKEELKTSELKTDRIISLINDAENIIKKDLEMFKNNTNI